MSVQSLFRSLKPQTSALDRSSVEPTHPHAASQWPLFQSVNAKPWDPSPALSAEEKLKRQVAAQSQTGLFDRTHRLRTPKVANQLAQGLRNMRTRPIEPAAIANTAPVEVPPSPVTEAPKAPQISQMQALNIIPTPLPYDKSAPIQAFIDHPVRATETEPTSAFRSRSSTLFMPSTESPLVSSQTIARAPEITAKTSGLLTGIFDKLQGTQPVHTNAVKPKQTLRSILGALPSGQRSHQ